MILKKGIFQLKLRFLTIYTWFKLLLEMNILLYLQEPEKSTLLDSMEADS